MKLKDFQYEQNYVQHQCYQETLQHLLKVANDTPVHIQSFKKNCQMDVPIQKQTHFFSCPK